MHKLESLKYAPGVKQYWNNVCRFSQLQSVFFQFIYYKETEEENKRQGYDSIKNERKEAIKDEYITKRGNVHRT
jgi:hypothetical protein